MTPTTITLLILFAADAARAHGHPRRITGTRTPWWTLPALAATFPAPIAPHPLAGVLAAVGALAGLRVTVWTIALIRHRRSWRRDMRSRERHARLAATERAYGITALRTIDGLDPFDARRNGPVQVRWEYHARGAQGVLTICGGNTILADREGRTIEPVTAEHEGRNA